MPMNEDEKKNFIREQIVGRKTPLGRVIRHYVRVILSAFLFGAAAAAAFSWIYPKVDAYINPKPKELVELVPESESAVETSTAAETEGEVPSEAIESVVQNEMQSYVFSISDYEAMESSFRSVITNAENSLVQITRRRDGTDFMGNAYESEENFAGVIVARTSEEILILTTSDVVSGTEALSASFLRGSSVPASVKAVDSTDGIAVAAVEISQLDAEISSKLSPIPIGNSRILARNTMLAAIGCPASCMYSSGYAEVTYLDFALPFQDSVVENVMLRLNADASMGTFLINTSGELVGWITKNLGDTADGYSRMAGVSDFIAYVEKLSNGEIPASLGVMIQDVSTEMMGSGMPDGVYVLSVDPDSAAYQAGIQSGDIVTSVNGEKVRNSGEFQRLLEGLNPGSEVLVGGVRQNGESYDSVSFHATAGTR